MSLVFSACGDSAADVVRVEGEYFPDDPEKRTPFRLEGDDARLLTRLVSGLEPTEHLTWQGTAVFTITRANGAKTTVAVCNAPAVLVDGKAYTADTEAILALVRKGLDPPPR